ncbi:MAG: nuclear transport factor 2 family protein [Erythrobacter sp.]|nr:nuclear transport factor 2 family protein [Erythrobacter sp.]
MGMTVDLQTLERRLTGIEDREAIRELIASYGPLADSGDAEGVASLWREDGSYEVHGFGTASGRDALAGFITSESHRGLMADGCAHLLGPVTIALNGDTATACGHSVVFRHAGDGFEAYRVSANRWTLAKADGTWRVTHRENALLDGDAAARALLVGRR